MYPLFAKYLSDSLCNTFYSIKKLDFPEQQLFFKIETGVSEVSPDEYEKKCGGWH